MNERPERDAFHDLLLPRSWILYAIRHRPKAPAEKPKVDDVVRPLETLLFSLYHWDGTCTIFIHSYRSRLTDRVCSI